VVEVEEREALMARLKEAGIGTGIAYRWPIHTMRGYAHLGYRPEDFPVAMRKAERIMSLPIYPALDMASAVRNTVAQLRVDLAEAARMASTYPAAFLDIAATHGQIAKGYVADFVVLNEAIEVRETWIAGNRVFVS